MHLVPVVVEIVQHVLCWLNALSLSHHTKGTGVNYEWLNHWGIEGKLGAD